MQATHTKGQEQFFKLFRLFMKESGNGKRLKKDGKKIRPGTIDNYIYCYKLLQRFCNEKQFELKLPLVSKMNQRELDRIKKYWKQFYNEFTTYLYKDLDYYDNYVGLVIKSLRTFLNYVKDEKNMDIGTFHKSFYVAKEEIPIVALSPEQVNYLIYNQELETLLPAHLHRIRDMFIFGCTVCVRVSDLLAINRQNIVQESGAHYLRLYAQKTGTFTSVKLPPHAIAILQKYQGQNSTLFPPISKDRFNAALKEMAQFLNYKEPIIKTRTKRGELHIVYKDATKRTHHTLADMISTHTMRRTGITTMLRLGMPDYLVRKISGHSAGSREFYRYVQLAQNYLDEKTDEVFEKLQKIN